MRALAVFALALLLVCVAAEAARHGFSVYEGDREQSVSEEGVRVEDVVGSRGDTFAVLAPHMTQRFSLFERPSARVTLIVKGLSPEHLSQFGVRSLGSLEGSPLALMRGLGGRRAGIRAPLNMHRLVRSMRSAGVPVRLDRKAGVLTLGESRETGVNLPLRSDHVAPFVRDLHTLASLRQELSQDEMAFLLRGLQHLEQELTEEEMQVARSALHMMMRSFLQSVKDSRVVTSVFFHHHEEGEEAQQQEGGQRRRLLLSEGDREEREFFAAESIVEDFVQSQSYGRSLAAPGSNQNSTAITEMDRAQYQLGVWSFILLAIILTSFMLSSCNMSFSSDKFTRELFREEKQAI